MNILVLTDFSRVANKAFDYAKMLTETLGGTVFQLHIISSRKKMNTEKEEVEAIQAAKKKMIKTSNAFPAKNISVINLVKIGKLEEVVTEVCNARFIDMIILGTRKKHSFLDYLLGSVSTILIHKVEPPVIIIPETISMTPIRRIAIATEDEKYDTPLFRFIKKLSAPFNANVNQVIVFPLPRDINSKKEQVYNPTWMEDEFDAAAEITIVRDLFVVRGLDYFIKKHQIDLMALNVPERKGLKKFFHRSLSKRMVYQSPVPLLIWNERDHDLEPV